MEIDKDNNEEGESLGYIKAHLNSIFSESGKEIIIEFIQTSQSKGTTIVKCNDMETLKRWEKIEENTCTPPWRNKFAILAQKLESHFFKIDKLIPFSHPYKNKKGNLIIY